MDMHLERSCKNNVNKGQRKPVLAVKDFSFSYENLNKPLFHQLSFELYERETTLLMGPSGSGKSSLALCLNGLYPEAVEGTSSGSIFFRGKNIRDFHKGEINQKIGIVFQDPDSQFCMLTVEDELAFTLENRKIPNAEMPKRISAVLQQIGMDGFQKRKIHELSGGQKQKIALASVLLLEPEVLILDEPTANLDPVSRLEFIRLIRSMQRQFGITVFIIEHQIDDWFEIADRVLVMGSNGRIIADGEVNTVFSENKNRLREEGVFLPQQFDDCLNHQNSKSIPTSFDKVIISIENLSFKRNEQMILKNMNLEIRHGEFVAIAGENGAGKSTLLQLMAGLLKPTNGEIYFQDVFLHHWNEKELRKRIGFVFQNPEHQFITDTVYDEITFGMKLNEESEEKIKSTANQLMQQFHLIKHRHSNPFSLSGGEKRRLSVATMLDETPDILFFDEPTSGQDAQTMEELMNIIEKLRENGTSIVFVTHDMDIVDQVDRVIVLHQQKIIYDGIPDNLWGRKELLKKARLCLPYRMKSHDEGVPVYDLVY